MLPSALQESLLRAALAEGTEAVSAWQSWRAATDVETLDAESYRLLPLLHHNLRRQGVDDPELGRYRSVRKHAWYRNRLAFDALAGLLRRFHEAGVRTLLLKGVVLATRHYPDVGLRPMEDFDVLVSPTSVPEVLGVVEALGWSPVALPSGRQFSLRATAFDHSWGFRKDAAGELDLHWFACSDDCRAGADDAFWAGAEAFMVDGVATTALCPADLLLHVIAHAYASHVAVARWVADAAMILRSPDHPIDWGRFVQATETRGLVLPVLVAMRTLARMGLVEPPPEVARHLGRLPTGWAERLEYSHRQSPDTYSTINRLLRLWFWNWRLAGRPSVWTSAVRFPGFMWAYYRSRPSRLGGSVP